MLVSIPFTADKLFRRRDIRKTLSFIASKRTFSLQQLVSGAALTEKSARSILKDLVWTEHLERRGRTFAATDKIGDAMLIVNLRDIRADRLFRYKATRQLLLEMCRGEPNLKDLSLRLGASYRMVKMTLQKLRQVEIACGKRVREEFVVQPKDPLELVPRRSTRLILQNLVSIIKRQMLPEHTSILYGRASWGELDPTLKILVLFNGCLEAQEQEKLMQGFVLAAGSLTSTFGQSVDLTFTLKEVWIAQKLGIAKPESLLIEETYDGICFDGEEPQLSDYFSLHQLATPAPPAKIAEWLEKGYIAEANGRYVYTEKAIETFRKKSPTHIVELHLSILGKGVLFITVGPRTSGYRTTLPEQELF